MSEEKQEEKQEQSPGPSEIELQAMELGWQPEEDFKASPHNEGKKWRTAEDFMDRKSLFDRLDSYKGRVRDLEHGLKALVEHNKTIEASTRTRVLAELKAERKAALEEGDMVKAEEIRDKIDEVRFTPPKPEVKTGELNPEFLEWAKKNSWYETDQELREAADIYAVQLLNRGVRTPSEALPMIEKKVREMYPNKFRNPNKDKAPTLDSGKGKVSVDSFKLTSQEEKIMETMIRAGVPISKEEYIKQLKDSRGV